MDPSAFKAARISRTSSITLHAPLERVFPLFGPVREMEWAAGWEPQVLYPDGSLMEEHMVFRTSARHGHEADYTWAVTQYRPDQAFIEYTVFTPERLWWITIQCRQSAADGITVAEVTYTYTGLTEIGNALNEKALAAMFRHGLKDWEEAIEHYLKTGERLEHNS